MVDRTSARDKLEEDDPIAVHVALHQQVTGHCILRSHISAIGDREEHQERDEDVSTKGAMAGRLISQNTQGLIPATVTGMYAMMCKMT